MIKLNKNEIDMLHGSIVDKIIFFAVPIAITSVMQQLFNACDIIVCGKFVGSIALAAVGANSQIINLFINSFLGLSIGANVMISNYIGAEKNEKIHNVVHTAMTFALLFGIFLMIVGLFTSKNILLFLGTPLEIIIPATIYLKIIFVTIPFMILYNFATAILRCIGDTRRPLIILIITGFLNIILNIILVVFVKIGVAGVAIATLVSNVVSAISVIYLLVKETSVIKLTLSNLMINFDSLSKIMRIGVPSAIQGMVFSISNLCVQSAVNSLGTNAIAANTAALSFEMFPYFIFSSFSSACLTFMSQNFGAKYYNRCKAIFKDCVIVGAITSIIFTIILEIFAKNFLYLFTSDMDVIDIALIRVRFAGALCFIQVLYDCCAAGLRALKHPYVSTVVVILGTVLFRIIWCITVFPIYKTYFVIVMVYPLSWIIINIVMSICYYVVSKKILGTTQHIVINELL